MRLIDADALNIHDVSPAYGMYVMGVTEEDIDDAPTIEAIPVDQIRKDIERRRAKGQHLVAEAMEAILEIWTENR